MVLLSRGYPDSVRGSLLQPAASAPGGTTLGFGCVKRVVLAGLGDRAARAFCVGELCSSKMGRAGAGG